MNDYYTDCWFNLWDRRTWEEAIRDALSMAAGQRYLCAPGQRYRVRKANGRWQIDFMWMTTGATS